MQGSTMQERRRQNRRKIGFYFQVLDTDTRELFGHLTNVSTLGFQLDCLRAVPLNATLRLSIETTAEVSDTEFIDLVVQSKWCRKDAITPNFFNAGFAILEITPHDLEVLKRIVETYASQ